MAQLKYLDATGISAYHGKIKVYIANQIASAGHLKRKIVEALPAVADADVDTIYLTKKADSAQTTGDVYNEYLLIDDAFELIGTTATSLDGYSTTEEVEGLIATAKSEAIAAAATDASTKADAALSSAKTYADTLVGNLDTTAGIPTSDIEALFD